MAEPIKVTNQPVIWSDAAPPTIYSNVFGIAMSPYDISIVFGEVGKATDTEIEGIQRVRISMSAELVPSLLVSLTTALETFVANNGPLRNNAMQVLKDKIEEHNQVLSEG